MKYLILSMLLFLSLIGNAQQTINQKKDSLLLLLESADTENRISLLIELGSELTSTNLDSSLLVVEQAARMAEEVGSELLLAKANIQLGRIFNYKSLFDSAIYYFSVVESMDFSVLDYDTKCSLFMNRGITFFYQANYEVARADFEKSLVLANDQKDMSDVSRCYNNIGLTYQYEGQFNEASNYLVRSAEIDDSLGNELSAAKSYNNIGILNSTLHNNEIANTYYAKSLEIKRRYGDLRGVVGTLINMGIVMKNSGMDEKSLTYYHEALAISQEINYTNGTLDVYNNLVVTHNHLEQFDKAIVYSKLALKMRKDTGATEEILLLETNLCDAYRLNGELPKAESMVASIVKRMEAVGNLRHLHEGYLVFSRVYSDIGDFEKALKFYEKHKITGDSIFNQERNATILDLQTKYDTEKKEKEITLLSAKNTIQKLELKSNQHMMIAMTIIAFLVIIFLVTMYSRRNYKLKVKLVTEKERHQKQGFKSLIEGEEKERKRIAQELHDGLGQLLSSARLNVSAMEDNFEEIVTTQWNNSLKLIDDAVTEVRHISHNMMPNALISIGFEAAIREQVHLINDAGEVNVHANFPDQKIGVSESEAIALYRIIQELLNNALKYSEAKNIWLDIEDNDQLEVNVRDDGKGFDTASISSSTGIGWRNIQSRIDILSGSIDINSEIGKGTKISLRFSVLKVAI